MTLGSIVVRLTMNTADFDTDSKRAASIAEKRAKQIDASFRKAGVAIGLALGAVAVGITTALKGAIDTMDETYNAAKKVGDSTENFSRLTYAAGLADVGMDQLVTTLGRLTKAQAAALDVGSEQAKVFKALGIEVTDANGALRGSTEVFLDFADVFQAMKGSPEAMAAGFALFGRSFQDMIPLLEQGSTEIRRLMQESDALGKTISGEAGAAADQFNDDMDRLKGAIGGAWMEIASGMLPQLTAMTGEMASAAKETDDLRSFGEGLATVLRALGESFGFVAGMARQFGIDVGYSIEMLRGLEEVRRNVATLGFADGTIAGGRATMANAGQTRSQLLAEIAAKRQRAEAQADIDRMLRNGVKYDGPLLEDGSQGKKTDPAEELRRRLAAALGGAAGKAKGGGKPKKDELTEEQKAAKALNEEYTRTAEGLRERLGLMGLETEAAKMKWETEEGSFKALDPMRKAELIAQAALVDAKQKGLEIAEDERRAAEDARESYERAIEDIQRERDTLGMTNEQLEIYNRLKWAGVDANSASGRAIIAETEALQKQRQSTEDQIERMDGLRSAANDFLDDLRAGETVWDSLSHAASNFAATLADIAQRKLIEQIFGQAGTAQGGSSGGWIGSLVGLFGSMFGGGAGAAASSAGQYSWIGNGYASGGWTGPGATNQPKGIVHADEVVWSKGDVARSGGVAAVESLRRGGPANEARDKRPLVVFNEAQMLDALAAHGGLEKVVVHYMERNRDRMRANM
ncbi:MAG TPA: hypothetical protein VLC71_05885 [Thermomonas sp.]|nr:hypothetical protein [Thermomonas sp.]